MWVILYLVSLSEAGFWGWWSVSLWTRLCYFVAIMHLFSQSLSIVPRCGGQLLNDIFSFLSARCVRWKGFALIRVSCDCVIDVIVLDCVCCPRLIRTRIIVRTVSYHLLLPELDADPLELEVSRCRKSQFARCFLPSQVRMWNDLRYSHWHRNVGWV